MGLHSALAVVHVVQERRIDAMMAVDVTNGILY